MYLTLLLLIVSWIKEEVNGENLAYTGHRPKNYRKSSGLTSPSFWSSTTFEPREPVLVTTGANRVNATKSPTTTQQVTEAIQNNVSQGIERPEESKIPGPGNRFSSDLEKFLRGEAKKEYPDIVPSENMREGFQKCAKERFKTTELDSEFKLQTYHIFHDCYKEEVVDIHKSMETGKIMLNVIYPITLCVLAFVVSIVVKECVAKQVGKGKAKRAGHTKLPRTPQVKRKI